MHSLPGPAAIRHAVNMKKMIPDSNATCSKRTIGKYSNLMNLDDRYLINYIDLDLELHRNTNEFLLQCFDSNAKDLKLK
uniref:Uncharacterized protein n=1 Tax=Romanomermis culicivorax TaxID=13658 RepID=A0A915HJ50_ROMCU